MQVGKGRRLAGTYSRVTKARQHAGDAGASELNVAYNGGMDARDLQAIEHVRQSRQEKAKAISLLAERYGQKVIALCQIYLPEREAQRIAEQTFEEFVRGNYEGHSLEDELDVSLLTIARRLSQARERAIGFEQFINQNGQNPGRPLSRKDMEDRMLLRLRLDLKFPWAVVAKIMGLSMKAAKQRGYNLGRRLKESKNVPRGT
jgi:hypothetical protein